MRNLVIWFFCFCAALPVYAADKEQQDDEEDTVYIRIPERLRGQGYSLKFDREILPLKGKRVVSPNPNWYQRVYLVSPDQRIVAVDKTYPDERALEDLEPDNMRIGMFFGSTIIHGEAFDEVFVADPLSYFSLEYIYQPGPLGFMLNLTTISTDHSTEFGNSTLRTTYNESQTRLGATYDFAPNVRSSGLMSTMHIMLYGGALSSIANVKITDKVVTIEDEDKQNGAFAGIEARWPWLAVWISGRLDYSYHMAKFNKFGLDNHAVQRNTSIGVSYGF